MDFVDLKYINLISSRLNNFKQIRDNVYNFRCPVCGDSKKNKSKSRGYIFETNNKRVVYKCHNAGCFFTLADFIKYLDQGLYEQFKLDKFTEILAPKRPKITKRQRKDPNFDTEVAERLHKQKLLSPLAPCTNLLDLNDGHPVLEYVRSRQIPEYQFHRLWATDSITELFSTFDHYKNQERPQINTPAVVIPFIHRNGVISHIQVRSVTSKFFLFIDLETGLPKIWGEDEIDLNQDIYIFEAVFDAMFVDNSLAFGGVNSHSSIRHILSSYGFERVVICFDNDYNTNKDVMRMLKQYINKGCRVLIYDKRFMVKDINDAVTKAGWSIDDINTYIKDQTFSGLRASLVLGSNLKHGNNFFPNRKIKA